jgi:hypothetical protein
MRLGGGEVGDGGMDVERIVRTSRGVKGVKGRTIPAIHWY